MVHIFSYGTDYNIAM